MEHCSIDGCHGGVVHLVVTCPHITVEIGVLGREIESRQGLGLGIGWYSLLGICWVVLPIGYMLGGTPYWVYVGWYSLLGICWVVLPIGYMLGGTPYWV
jgi:hypothetical protein